MTIGEFIILSRKKKKLSQAALLKATGTSVDFIGIDERLLITPFIEVIIKVADTLKVSIDFLVGKTDLEHDKQIIERLEDISKLSEENKSFVLKMMDKAIKNFQTKKAFATE